MTSMLQKRDIGTPILNNVFDLQFGSHQSRSHRKCFLVTLADSSLGHSVAFSRVRSHFAVLTFQRLED